MSEEERFEMRKSIKLTFLHIGIRCDMLGFNYFCDSVEFAIAEPDLLNHLCDGLYKKVGMKNHVKNVSSVERSMRHALDDCYEIKIFSKPKNVLDRNFFRLYNKPTVGELIRIVTQCYLLGLLKY